MTMSTDEAVSFLRDHLGRVALVGLEHTVLQQALAQIGNQLMIDQLGMTERDKALAQKDGVIQTQAGTIEELRGEIEELKALVHRKDELLQQILDRRGGGDDPQTDPEPS